MKSEETSPQRQEPRRKHSVKCGREKPTAQDVGDRGEVNRAFMNLRRREKAQQLLLRWWETVEWPHSCRMETQASSSCEVCVDTSLSVSFILLQQALKHRQRYGKETGVNKPNSQTGSLEAQSSRK